MFEVCRLWSSTLEVQTEVAEAQMKLGMARPEGFEPPTQGLELPGSIQAELRARSRFKILTQVRAREISGGLRL